MPCLNEAETVAQYVEKALQGLRKNGICGEVVIADNGSTDGSARTCHSRRTASCRWKKKATATHFWEESPRRKGKYVVMGDADDSYDFSHISRASSRNSCSGYDLVMGNRFRGGIQPGAMPALHRYLGNPVLSGIGRLFFGSPCGDFHCGLRGFSKQAVARLDLRTTGMEFASEMVVKATLHGLRIGEVPTTLAPDGRSRAAPSQLARRLAALAVSALVQPSLAVPLPPGCSSCSSASS